MKLSAAVLPFLLFLVSGAGHADQKAIEQSLREVLPGTEVPSIRPTPMKGLYEVMVGPRLFYASEDGKFLIQGTLIDVKSREDLTEPRMAAARIAALDKVGKDSMLIFKPKLPQHVAYVFTDIDCGYCRKLHSEIDQYLKAGIEVRYLFFPRAGAGSDSYKKAVSVWCAEDRNRTFTRAKKGETIPEKQCDNPVDEHLALGTDLGASGTPMIVTEQGNILPGYVPANQLAQVLSQETRQKASQAN